MSETELQRAGRLFDTELDKGEKLDTKALLTLAIEYAYEIGRVSERAGVSREGTARSRAILANTVDMRYVEKAITDGAAVVMAAFGIPTPEEFAKKNRIPDLKVIEGGLGTPS